VREGGCGQTAAAFFFLFLQEFSANLGKLLVTFVPSPWLTHWDVMIGFLRGATDELFRRKDVRRLDRKRYPARQVNQWHEDQEQPPAKQGKELPRRERPRPPRHEHEDEGEPQQQRQQRRHRRRVPQRHPSGADDDAQ
jgi:hypothetical protein